MSNFQKWIVVLSILLIALSILTIALNGRYESVGEELVLDKWTGDIWSEAEE